MSSTENFQRMWLIFKLATETQMPDFESNSPTVTCSCQVWLKGADKMKKAKPAPEDAEHMGLWGAGVLSGEKWAHTEGSLSTDEVLRSPH